MCPYTDPGSLFLMPTNKYKTNPRQFIFMYNKVSMCVLPDSCDVPRWPSLRVCSWSSPTSQRLSVVQTAGQVDKNTVLKHPSNILNKKKLWVITKTV